MKLALITPCDPQLLTLTALLPARFCIAPVAVKNEYYRNYFVGAQNDYGNVILDNGIFEGQRIPHDEYVKLMDTIKPKVVILPDTINGNCEENFKEALEAYTRLAPNCPTAEFMFVLQCEPDTKDEVVFETLRAFIDSPIKWLGICRDFAYQRVGHLTQTTEQELNRYVLGCEWQAMGWIEALLTSGKKIHYLGIGENVHLLQYAWFVDSADTASFCWQSMLGNELTNGIMPQRYRRPYNYFDLQYRGNDTNELEHLHRLVMTNCREAQYYADQASKLKWDLLGGRL